MGQWAIERPGPEQGRVIEVPMSRLVVTVIVALVILVGGMFLLAGRATERAPVTVEKAVDLANLS
jgi:hypothetical protein